MRRLVVALALVPLAAVHGQSGAPDSAAFAVEAPETVVTAGRLPTDAARTGRNVSVLTAADIARSPARSLDELLRVEAGVLVTPRSAFGAQADLSLRGGTFNGVVVLVDGARFNDPMTGHFLSDVPIPLAEIARIEIVRGPETAAWGPDALGGVVHILTHTGALGAVIDPRDEGSDDAGVASATAGGLGTVAGDAAVRSVGPSIGFSAAATGIRTDGPAFLDDDGSEVVGSDGPVRADLKRAAATASVAAPVPALGAALYVRGALDARQFGAVQFYTPFASDTAREATSTQWLQARLASPAGRTAWAVQLSGRRHTDRYTYYPGLDPNRHTSRRLGLTADLRRALSPRLTVGAGVSAEARDIASNSLGEHGDVSGGVFALARWAPVAPLAVSASARLDADPGFGVEPTPMLAVAYRVAPGVGLRAAAGRAVRAPTYVERYFNTVAPRPGGNLGNPDLRAERAWNAEAGLDLTPVPGVTVQATAFYRQTDDLVDYVRTSVGGEEVFFAQNVLGAEAAGVETSAALRQRLGPEQTLRLTAAYTATDVHLDAGAFAEGDFKYVLDHAPHLVQGRASLEAGRAVVSVEGLHKTRVGQESVTVVHARLAADVGGGRAPVEAFGEVRNVFDARYAEVFGAPMPGRVWLAGLRLTVGR